MTTKSEGHPEADGPFKAELLDCLRAIEPYSRRLTQNRSAAEDLLQDTLLRALEKHYQWERGTNLIAWLRTIMRNRFLEGFRKQQPLYASDLSDDGEIVKPEEANQPVRIELRETGQAIERLPFTQRRILEMVAIDGVSYMDAARDLNLPVGTVRSRLSRARTALRMDLEATRRYPVHSPATTVHAPLG